MVSSTAEADLESQTRVVTDPLPTNNAGAPSTDITPNPQPPPNHNPRLTNDPSNAQAAKNLEVQRGILTCPIHGLQSHSSTRRESRRLVRWALVYISH